MKTEFNVIFRDVVSILDNTLPDFLTYHTTEHTLYVLEKAIYIAEKENIKNDVLELIKIAALYHDIGFTKTHVEHEKEGCRIARRHLKDYGYPEADIDAVCGMIMATRLPQTPQNLSEKILVDADLEYLATSNYWSISEALFKELKHFDDGLTKTEWRRIQIDFIKKHTYHTDYCKRYKKFRKFKNLERLQSQD